MAFSTDFSDFDVDLEKGTQEKSLLREKVTLYLPYVNLANLLSFGEMIFPFFSWTGGAGVEVDDGLEMGVWEVWKSRGRDPEKVKELLDFGAT